MEEGKENVLTVSENIGTHRNGGRVGEERKGKGEGEEEEEGGGGVVL